MFRITGHCAAEVDGFLWVLGGEGILSQDSTGAFMHHGEIKTFADVWILDPSLSTQANWGGHAHWDELMMAHKVGPQMHRRRCCLLYTSPSPRDS